jgi:hypothetical protein
MAPGRARLIWAVTWRLTALLALALVVRRLTAAEECLPSLAEQGRRLSEMPSPSVLWLEPLLRQHEACWAARAAHDHLRVFVYGGGPVQGWPHRAEDTTTAHLNELWKSTALPAHAYNFGFATAHAMKDMLIVRESLRYRPDVLVYGVSPVDFRRGLAVQQEDGLPGPFGSLVRFMRNSAAVLRAFAAEEPAGLQRPLDEYRQALDGVERRWSKPLSWPVGEVTTFVYTALATRLRPLGERLGLVGPPGDPAQGLSTGPYSCRFVRWQNARDYPPRRGTNPLAYLAQVRDRTGIPVVVVLWPISNEPFEDCVNVHLTKHTVERYKTWLRAETQRLGMPLVDLSSTLLPRDFLDALHPNARGQRKIAGALSAQIRPILRERAATVLPVRPH